eukprot:6350513-Pyramimonas_sp.AAC.1
MQHTMEIIVAAEVREVLEKMREEGTDFDNKKGKDEKQDEEDGSDEDENRELQVIVGGFKEETEEDEIVQAIE